jgi:hypothetical protein
MGDDKAAVRWATVVVPSVLGLVLAVVVAAQGCGSRDLADVLRDRRADSSASSWDGGGRLVSLVRFNDLTYVGGFRLLSYEITTDDGTAVPLTGFSIGSPKGGGRTFVFDVDHSVIPPGARQVTCRYVFEIRSWRFELRTAFRRDRESGEWEVLRDRREVELIRRPGDE